MTVQASDTLHRANNASSWGTSSDGETYTTSGPYTFSITNTGSGQSSGAGKILSNNTANACLAILGSNTIQDATGSVRFQVNNVAHDVAIILRKQAAVTYYMAEINAGSLELMKVVTSTVTSLTSVTVTESANTLYNLTFECSNTSPTTLKAKMWADGSAEPDAWTVILKDSTSGLQTAGGYGLRYKGGNTDYVLFDNFEVDAITFGGNARDTYKTAVGLKDQFRSTFKTSLGVVGRIRDTFKTAMHLIEAPRGKFSTQFPLNNQPRPTFKTASILSSATRSKFITKFTLAELTRITYKTAAGIKSSVRDTFKTAIHTVGRSRDTYKTQAGIKLPTREKFSTQITGMKNDARGKFNTRFTLLNTVRDKFYNASILAVRTRETFYNSAKLSFDTRDKFTTLAGLRAVVRDKFTTAIHFLSQPRTTYKTQWKSILKNRAAFSIRFPLSENTRGKFLTQITGMGNATRSHYITAISLVGRTREVFKVFDIAGLLHLGASVRDTFYTAAILKTQSRDRFHTRFPLGVPERGKFFNAMILKFGDRTKFNTRFQLSETTRNKFYTRFSGGAAVWDKFYTRAGLTSKGRSKFFNRAILAFSGRAKEYIAAHLKFPVRDAFNIRYGLVGRTRDLYYTKAILFLQTRSKAFTSAVLKIVERTTFYNRAVLSSSAHSQFRILAKLATQLQDTFSLRFGKGVAARTTFNTNIPLLGEVRTTFITAYSLIGRLQELFTTRAAPRKFKSTFLTPFNRYSAAFNEVYVANPNSTIYSDVTVIDNNNVLQNALPTVNVSVLFPDGSLGSYSLSSGVANLGNGKYQLNYLTKSAGMNKETWTFTAGDGSTLTTTNNVPVTY